MENKEGRKHCDGEKGEVQGVGRGGRGEMGRNIGEKKEEWDG